MPIATGIEKDQQIIIREVANMVTCLLGPEKVCPLGPLQKTVECRDSFLDLIRQRLLVEK